MGIDYFLFNKTKNEYAWLGRFNPIEYVGAEGELLTERILDKAFTHTFAEEISWETAMFPKNELALNMIYYERLLNYYNILKELIKTDECIIISDVNDNYISYIDNMTNNVKLEDRLFNDIWGVFNIMEGLI